MLKPVLASLLVLGASLCVLAHFSPALAVQSFGWEASSTAPGDDQTGDYMTDEDVDEMIDDMLSDDDPAPSDASSSAPADDAPPPDGNGILKTSTGAWMLENKETAMGDRYLAASTSANATLKADDGHDYFPWLTTRCQGNSTRLLFTFQSPVVGPKTYASKVRIRLDADVAKSYSLEVSTDQEAIGYFEGGKAIPLIEKMLGAKLVRLEVTPPGKSPTVIDFNVDGMDKAIAGLRTACHW